MQRLSGVDSAFLSLETPTTRMHIVGVIILDPSTVEDGYSFDNLKRLLLSRIHRMPPFYRRVRKVPFNIEHPYWVKDPNFDVDNHVRRMTIPAPGGRAELGKLVGQIAAAPLDRDRPLWEVIVIEGLENGHVALVTKMHHAAGDGMASGYLMLQMLDMSPEVPDIEEPTAIPSEPVPTDGEMLRKAMRDRLQNPLRVGRQARKTIGKAAELMRYWASKGTDNFSPVFPFMAPKTMFNRTISAERVAAFGQASLDDFKVARKGFNCTVNDVVLAACTGALRRYLLDHADLPDKALVASCPVSVRRPEENMMMSNRVSTLFVRLPVHIDDPQEQIRIIATDTRDAKTVHNAMGADMLQDWAELAAPYAFTAAARAFSRMRLSDRLRPVHNLIVSNVPGPPIDLYCLGAKVVVFYPLGPVLEGAGLNITVVSKKDEMDMGIMACPDSAPNPQLIADYFCEAAKELRRLAEEKLSEEEASA